MTTYFALLAFTLYFVAALVWCATRPGRGK
jgi:hypothetical protein